MPDTTPARLRARHDAGRPPYAWRRLLVLVGSLGVTTGLTVTGAGLLRQGPLAWLGWSEQALGPQQVVAAEPGGSAVDLKVALRWSGAAFCPQNVRLEVEETATQVVIRRVVSRVPRLGMVGSTCPVPERRATLGQAVVDYTLAGPLGGRPVVCGDGKVLRPRNA